MKRHVEVLLLITLISVMVAAQVPISFHSSQHPNSILIKLEMNPNVKLRLRSAQMIPNGDHWTSVSSFGPQLTFSPSPQSKSVLFNEKHQDKNVLAFYQSFRESKSSSQHFHYVQTDNNGNKISFLLPLFSQELPSFRTDRLFRCDDTLISVDWRDGDAHIVAFSELDNHWNIQESVDDGVASEDGGIRYGYIVDKAHTHPVKVEIGGKKYCTISQQTQPAQLGHSWNYDFYMVGQVIDLFESLPLLDIQSPTDSQL